MRRKREGGEGRKREEGEEEKEERDNKKESEGGGKEGGEGRKGIVRGQGEGRRMEGMGG